MHEPPVLKRSNRREGDTQSLAFYHSLVNAIYYSNDSKRNEDYLNRDIQDDLEKRNQETGSRGPRSIRFFFCQLMAPDLDLPSSFVQWCAERTS